MLSALLNGNTGAYKDLYPNQQQLGPGEWGYHDPNDMGKIGQDWFSDQKKLFTNMMGGFLGAGAKGGGWGAKGGGAWGGAFSDLFGGGNKS